MTSLTNDEIYDRLLHSLRENSAEFAKKEHQKRRARMRLLFLGCLIFAAGAVAGALLATAAAN